VTRVALGIDVGGTNVRAALVDVGTGAVLSARRAALEGRTPEEVVRAVCRAVCRAAREAVADGQVQPAAAGAGVAAQLEGETGRVLSAPNLGWRDVALGELLAAGLGFPVLVVNDLAAAAWGELRHGAARGASDALVVFAGTGVGSAIVAGGRLLGGAHGVAGEIGHVKVEPPPGEPERRCGCGAVGCLEAYAGGAGIAARLREASADGKWAGAPSMGEVELAAAAGDPWASAFRESTAARLGRAVADAVTLLDPGLLVLGGGLLLGNPALRASVERVVRSEASGTALAALSVRSAALGDDAGVIGAALLSVNSPTVK
jgi:glucokinase